MPTAFASVVSGLINKKLSTAGLKMENVPCKTGNRKASSQTMVLFHFHVDAVYKLVSFRTHWVIKAHFCALIKASEACK